MAGDVDIRMATAEDVALILSFIKALADYEKRGHQVTADEARLRETLFGKYAYAETLIADLNGEPAGFALFFHTYSTFLARPAIYLEDLFVKPDLRGRGIGKTLLARLAQLSEERGCGRLEWSVLNWNQPAIDFYRSLGAEPLDNWTHYRLTGEALKRLARR